MRVVAAVDVPVFAVVVDSSLRLSLLFLVVYCCYRRRPRCAASVGEEDEETRGGDGLLAGDHEKAIYVCIRSSCYCTNESYEKQLHTKLIQNELLYSNSKYYYMLLSTAEYNPKQPTDCYQAEL